MRINYGMSRKLSQPYQCFVAEFPKANKMANAKYVVKSKRMLNHATPLY